MKPCGWCRRQFSRPLSKDPEHCDKKCDKEAAGRFTPSCVRCTAPFTLKDSKRVGKLRQYCSPKCIALDQMPYATRRDPKWDAVSKAVRKRDGKCLFASWVSAHKARLTKDEWLTVEPFLTKPCDKVLTAHHRYKKSVFPEFKYEAERCLTLCLWAHHKKAVHDPRLQGIMFKLELLVSRKSAYTESN